MSYVTVKYPSQYKSPLQIYVTPQAQKKAEELIRRCPEIMRNAYEKGATRFAKILLAEIKHCLMTGMPPAGSGVSWKPLSPRTIKAYKSWKFPEAHLWYLTGQMYRRISIIRTKSKLKEIKVGFPTGVRALSPQKGKNTRGRPTLNALSSMLEAGTNRVPPRPLFVPAYKAVGGQTRLRKFIVEELKKELRKYRGK